MNSLFSLFRSPRNASRPEGAVRPALETLEGRVVPSTVDLTQAGSVGSVGGAIFVQDVTQPSGVGVIDAFIRIKAPGNSTVEQGYNTDARPLQFNEMKSSNFTRDLPLSSVPTVTIDGVAYKQFELDVNQTGSSPLLSLDQLRIYAGSAPDLSVYDSTSGKLAGLTPLYDLNPDLSNTNSVLLNGNLAQGIGKGDMMLEVPAGLFPATNNGFIYLYSHFGNSDPANSGFEQWAVQAGLPAPVISSLSGTVYIDASGNGSFTPGDAGIAGAVITLTGVNDLNQTINMTTVTDSFGNYSFVGLRAGQYMISEALPASLEGSFTEGASNVGNMGGFGTADLISQIQLQSGVAGLNYNFGEVPPVMG
jgi:hypothetical protein